MAARHIDRALRMLAAGALVAGASLAASPPALAQSDWFRPPGNVGQPSARPVQRQPQARQPSQRQQGRQPVQRQAAPAPRQNWSPFQPLIDLFGGGGDRPRTAAPRVPRNAAPPPVVRAPAIVTPAEPRGTVYDTVAAAREEGDVKQVVLVLGDEYAGPLAQGLADAFAADRKEVAVAGRSESGSGLGPASGFDWLATARQPVGDLPNITVLFAGANDLVPIEDPAGRAELLDERWREIYGRRLDEMFVSLKAQGRPVAVVGLPPVEDDNDSERRVQFNALLQEHAERAGLIFIDVSDGFVDENGKFMMSGPAVDGQRRRLRAADGVGFTRAGGRKLAFFVDRALDDLLARPGEAVPAAAANPADARPSIILLTGGATPGARALAGAPGGSVAPAPAVQDGPPEASRVLISGEALPSVAGRTDDFRWPAGQAAATAEPLVPAMPGGTALPTGPVPAIVAPGTPTGGAGMGTATP